MNFLYFLKNLNFEIFFKIKIPNSNNFQPGHPLLSSQLNHLLRLFLFLLCLRCYDVPMSQDDYNEMLFFWLPVLSKRRQRRGEKKARKDYYQHNNCLICCVYSKKPLLWSERWRERGEEEKIMDVSIDLQIVT